MDRYFSVRYGDIIVFLYHEEMEGLRESLYRNRQREKLLKRFLEYCYMVDVKIALEGVNGEKTKGLKAASKYVEEHDMWMADEQLLEMKNILENM